MESGVYTGFMEKVLEEKLPELLQANPSDVFLWKLYTTGDFYLHREKHPPKKLCKFWLDPNSNF